MRAVTALALAMAVVAIAALAGAACASTGDADRGAERADVTAQARPLAEALQGCTVEDDGTRMRCAGVVVDVREGAWETTFEQRAAKKAEDLLAKAVFDDVRVDVLGRIETLRRAKIAAVYGDAHLTTLVFVKAGGGKAGERSFTCEAPVDVAGGPERCVEILASYLAESPSLAAAAAATSNGAAAERGAPRAAFGARDLGLVPGCEAAAAPPGGRLECPAATVAWRPFKTIDEAVAAALEASLPYQGIANADFQDGVPCRIAGEPAQCSQVTVLGAEPMVLVAGVAWVDGVPYAATCRAAVQVVDANVCGGLVTVER